MNQWPRTRSSHQTWEYWVVGHQTLDATSRHRAQNRAGLAWPPMDRALGLEPCLGHPKQGTQSRERGALVRRDLVVVSMLLAPWGPLVPHLRDIAAQILVETHQSYRETPRNASDASAGRTSMRGRAWCWRSQFWPWIVTTGGLPC